MISVNFFSIWCTDTAYLTATILTESMPILICLKWQTGGFVQPAWIMQYKWMTSSGCYMNNPNPAPIQFALKKQPKIILLHLLNAFKYKKML